MDITILKSLLGWCLVINYGVLLFWFAVLMLARDWITGLHSRMFDIDAATVSSAHYTLMGHFKLLVFVFNLAPWIALLILGY